MINAVQSRRNSQEANAKLAMKVIYYVFSAIVVLLSSNCCSDMRQLNEPERPSRVRGWGEYRIGTVTYDGDFVLNKGESTDNGKIGISLVDTYAGKCGLFTEREYPRAKLRFYRVSDQTVLCESTFFRGNSSLDIRQICGADFEWSTIGITDINSKENWIAFDLRK